MGELHKTNLDPTSTLCSFANKISLHVHEAVLIDTTKYLDHLYLHHCYFKGVISLKQYLSMDEGRFHFLETLYNIEPEVRGPKWLRDMK